MRAAPLLTSMGDEKDRDGLLFVLLVYAASRLFYLVAGALFASVVPVGALSVRARTAPSASARQLFASACDLNVLRIFLSSPFE